MDFKWKIFIVGRINNMLKQKTKTINKPLSVFTLRGPRLKALTCLKGHRNSFMRVRLSLKSSIHAETAGLWQAKAYDML